MPLYTLIHGGLTVEKKHYPHGSEVELSEAEASRINARGQHLKLSSVIKAEKAADEAKAHAVAKAEAEAKATTKKEKTP